MYPLPEDGSPDPPRILSHIPSTKPVDVVVRVYIVKVLVNTSVSLVQFTKYLHREPVCNQWIQVERCVLNFE